MKCWICGWDGGGDHENHAVSRRTAFAARCAEAVMLAAADLEVHGDTIVGLARRYEALDLHVTDLRG